MSEVMEKEDKEKLYELFMQKAYLTGHVVTIEGIVKGLLENKERFTKELEEVCKQVEVYRKKLKVAENE